MSKSLQHRQSLYLPCSGFITAIQIYLEENKEKNKPRSQAQVNCILRIAPLAQRQRHYAQDVASLGSNPRWCTNWRVNPIGDGTALEKQRGESPLQFDSATLRHMLIQPAMETVEPVKLPCLRIRKVRFFVSAPLPCRLRVGHQFLALAMLVRVQPRQPYSGVVELVKRLSLEQEVDGPSPSSRATGISEVVSRHLWEMEAVSSILTSQTTPSRSPIGQSTSLRTKRLQVRILPRRPVHISQLVEEMHSKCIQCKFESYCGYQGRLPQLAEGSDLKSVQDWFESNSDYHICYLQFMQ